MLDKKNMFSVFNRISLSKHLKDFDGSCLRTVVLGQFLEPNFQTKFQPCEKCPKQMCGSHSIPAADHRPRRDHFSATSTPPSLAFPSDVQITNTTRKQSEYLSKLDKPSNHNMTISLPCPSTSIYCRISCKQWNKILQRPWQSSGWKPKLTRPSGLEGRPHPES